MANDLIDRKALAEELSSLRMYITGLRAGKGVLNEFMTEYRKSVLRIVNDAPAVDAEPVRHGEWENYPSHSYRRCSICKMEWEKPRFNTRSNYCPNCGAKMDIGK